MKIKSINLKNFKRFTNFNIENIPQTEKLIILIGPNGCGKSSLLEAFLCKKNWSKTNLQFESDKERYLVKDNSLKYAHTSEFQDNTMKIEIHDVENMSNIDWREKLYIRSA